MNTYPISHGNNTYQVFIQIYLNFPVIKKLQLLPYLFFFNCIELLFTIVTLCLNTMLLFILLHSSRFHINLIRLYTMMLIKFQFIPLSRLVLVLYQYEVVTIKNILRNDLPLLIASFIRTYLMAFGACILPMTAIERFCATIYMVDYETKPKTSISTTLIFTTITASTIITGISVFALCIDVVTTLLIIAPAYILTSSSCAVFIYYMNEYNRRTLKDLINGHDPNKYGLSKRFQLQENISAYSLIQNINISSCSMNCFMVLIGTIGFIVFTRGTTLSIFMMALFDLAFAMYPVVVDINLILTIDDWKDKFMVLLRKMSFQKPAQRRTNRVQPRLSTTTNQYFQYYKEMW